MLHSCKTEIILCILEMASGNAQMGQLRLRGYRNGFWSSGRCFPSFWQLILIPQPQD